MLTPTLGTGSVATADDDRRDATRLGAADVIGLRLSKLASGGDAASAEAHLMVIEKVAAGFEAVGALMMGGSPDDVIQRCVLRSQANQATTPGAAR